jgi:inhibitor of KinA
MNKPTDPNRFSPVGDSALLFNLSDEISSEVNNQIMALDSRLREKPIKGISECVPAYASLLILYDPLVLDFLALKEHVNFCINEIMVQSSPPRKRVTISVCYGGEGGPDLERVAEIHGLSPYDVVKLHAAPTYRVGMMGFTPGFAYLMGLDLNLATPRRDSPRTQVPEGSVGIAGSQTGVYPLESPGGWQLIGRTKQALYDPDREDPFLLSPGDEVRFTPLPEGVMP